MSFSYLFLIYHLFFELLLFNLQRHFRPSVVNIFPEHFTDLQSTDSFVSAAKFGKIFQPHLAEIRSVNGPFDAPRQLPAKWGLVP